MISFPLEVNPQVLLQRVYTYLQARIPGWTPAEGSLDVWLSEAISSETAELIDVASRVPDTIFRYFGKSLIGLQPIDATAAQTTTTWTMINSAGYTIPAGTQVGIRDALGVLQPFETINTVVVPPGSTTTAAGAITVVALNPGTAATGIGGVVELIDILTYVTTIATVSVTAGGVDAETDAQYLSRLSARLRLLTQTPILPPDFAALALNIAPVFRAVAIDGYNPNANERETITVDATSGTFTLTFSGQTTGTIAWNASAATVQTALEALSNIAPGDIIVTGGPLATAAITVEFTGVYAGTNVTQMTANSASLAGGTHTATIVTTREGSQTENNERMVAVAAVDSSGEAVSGPTKIAIDTYLQSLREASFIVNVFDPTYTSIAVTVTVVALPGFDPTAVDTAVTSAITNYLSPSNWGFSGSGTDRPSDVHTWINETIVRKFQLARVIENVDGVDYISSALQIAIQGGSMVEQDVTLPGRVPLPRPGTINVTVT